MRVGSASGERVQWNVDKRTVPKSYAYSVVVMCAPTVESTSLAGTALCREDGTVADDYGTGDVDKLWHEIEGSAEECGSRAVAT